MSHNIASKIEDAFSFFKSSHYRGVPGVFCIEGAEPGPIVGITFCTHGNEPSGLAAAYDFVNYVKRYGDTTGKIILSLNNIAAAKKFFVAKTPDDKFCSRYIDIDMNRLPSEILELTNDKRSEVVRAKELSPIWKEFEYALDIHSTTLKTVPFIINLNRTLPKNLIRGIPINRIISNIDTIQHNHPVAHFYGSKQKPAYSIGIECGSHDDQESFFCAAEALFMFLNNTGVIQRDSSAIVTEYMEYRIVQAIRFPNLSYRLERLFGNFEVIEKNQVLARGNGHDITAQHAGHAFFASRAEGKNTHDEMLFLSKPAKAIKL